MDNLEEMDKKYSPARLTREEIENVNTPIKVMKLKLWLKIFQQTKVQDQMASQVNSIKHLEN